MIKFAIASALIALPVAAFAEGSPYLPIPGSGQVSVGLTNQSGDDFWVGSTKMTLPAKIKFNNLSVGAQYGLTDSLAIDGTLTYTSSRFGVATGASTGNESALSDSTVGIKWRLVDEFDTIGAPTVSLRAGAIIKGNYATAKIDAINDGASGVEVSVLLGKYLTPALSISGELGYRQRGNTVPKDMFGAIDLNYGFNSVVSASLGFSSVRASGNLDIGGPGFSPARFQEVKEERDLVRAGVNFNLLPGTSLSFNLGKVTAGRNTIKADVIGVALTQAF